MTDLHTHILPGMDDGANTPEAALALLEKEFLQGVRRIALTSHYHCEAEVPEAFLARRSRAFSELLAAVPKGLSLKTGCEVFFSPELLNIDVRQLCLEGTDVMLLELPLLQKPAFLREVLMGLRERGIVPLIAHVERYTYVRKDPGLLKEWISLGALIQVNAGSLTGSAAAFSLALIRCGLVHVLASDTHSIGSRPPDLRSGLDAVRRRLGTERARALERNAARIFAGQNVPATGSRTPKQVLGFWI